jgi:AcrR family transcriptional regulator
MTLPESRILGPMATRRDLQKQATREQLFTRAMELFEERGYDDVNIDDIVTACQVARGTFYFHFPKKDDLLYEAIKRGEAHIIAKMAAVPPDRPLVEVLTATTDGFADHWGHRPTLLPHAGAVAIRRIAAVADERDNEPLRVELVKHVERAVQSGELRSPLPSQMMADVFLLDVFAALMAWAATQSPPLPVVMQGVIGLFLHGVAVSD